MRGRLAAGRRGHGSGGWLRRAARWGIGIGPLAVVLALFGSTQRVRQANAALTVHSLTVPSVTVPSVTVPSVTVPSLPVIRRSGRRLRSRCRPSARHRFPRRPFDAVGAEARVPTIQCPAVGADDLRGWRVQGPCFRGFAFRGPVGYLKRHAGDADIVGLARHRIDCRRGRRADRVELGGGIGGAQP